MNFDAVNEEYVRYTEEYLKEFFSKYDDEPQQILYDAMRYSIFAGGKRLRPVLTYEFCKICGGEWRAAAPFAAALEMVHTYSLIHDDLPCMDNDAYRRGKPTNHKVYGEAIAILAGDALLTDAFSVAARGMSKDPARAIGVLAGCAGSAGMVGGQVLDILSEERECTEQEVKDIQRRKTGALIKAACILGVLAADGSEEQIIAASTFAENLGLAFQIRDDILDVIGNSELLGKSVGTDEGKNTFVNLYGLEACEKLVESHTMAALESLNLFTNTENLRNIAVGLIQRVV